MTRHSMVTNISTHIDKADNIGDEATQKELEVRARSFDVEDWWKHRKKSLMARAQENLDKAVSSQTAILYNPYEGRFSGRQLGESIDEFLQRLPPATTTQSNEIPWVYIANPHRDPPKSRKLGGFKPEFGQEEAPVTEEEDWPQFVVTGGKLLEDLRQTRHDIEKRLVGKAKQTITKALNPRKEETVKKLLDTATKCRCTSGKESFLTSLVTKIAN